MELGTFCNVKLGGSDLSDSEKRLEGILMEIFTSNDKRVR